MKVLVWKAHGDISVYDISTPEKFKARISEMLECVEGWGLDKTVALVEQHIAKHSDDMIELRKAFNTVCNKVGNDHEMFEDVFITELKNEQTN